MKVLDLTNNVEYSAKLIDYTVSRFPDGQQSITLNHFHWLEEQDLNVPVKIHSHLNSFVDLELIICAKKALDHLGVKHVILHVPYFLGARSDRKFLEGSIHYLRDVICPIINSLKFDSVVVLDPHSDVLEACLDNMVKIDNHLLVKHALTAIDNRDGAQERTCLISPDAGAYKKIFDVAKKFGISKVFTATKVRDMKTGKILHTEIYTPYLPDDTNYVIVDDICDGGRTFIEIAKAIKQTKPNAKLYLIVTHGIFSSGFVQLGNYFNGIYCTNSVQDIVKDVEDTDIEREMKEKVTQFNVFK